MNPQRIQLRRVRGYRKPEGAVVVARPTVWGNPFRVDRHRGDGKIWVTYSLGTDDVEEVVTVGNVAAGRLAVVIMYRAALWEGHLLFAPWFVRQELGGRDLACWCPLEDAEGIPVPCHGNVLLRVAAGDAL